MDLSQLVELGKKFADARENDPEKAAKYQAALEEGLKALDTAKDLLSSAFSEDKGDFEIELTKYADVNELKLANAKMDRAIEDIDRGPEFEDVLSVIKTVATVGITLATLA